MTPNARYYQARAALPGEYGIVHFLIREDEGRSTEQSSRDVLRAGFLSMRFDSPLHEFVTRAQLKEISEDDFTLRRGSRIGSNEVSGMDFYWLR